MKQTSVPEQALFYYIKKYIDKNALNNKTKINRYVLDITFLYKNQKYDIEYDSYSMHHNSYDKDIKRNEIIKKEGFIVYRMRDIRLSDLPNCINITMQFDNYSKKQCNNATNAIVKLFNNIGVENYDIDVLRDLEIIKSMYYNY